MKNIALLVILTSLFCSCSRKHQTLETEHFRMGIDRTGHVISLIDKSTGKDYFPKNQESSLISIRIEGQYESPSSALFQESDQTIVLHFSKNLADATIRFEEKKSHITFELLSVETSEEIELVLWGPFPTTISKTIGESVGVVRDDDFAIGIQALNLKTLGGYPTNEDDSEPAYDIFSTSSYVDVQDSIKILYRGQTARIAEYGSILQAYCRNRNKERVTPVWNHDRYVVPAFEDGGITGSKIALFGSPADQALSVLGEIEVEENLPHPFIDGKWGKISPGATAAYLIVDFGENNLDEALNLVSKAGLKYLYHGSPFENWGHFDLREELFPDNWESLKRCVARAEEQGIRIGVHTLSNFITTNDPYVTPVPDPRLAGVGESHIVSDIDRETTEIEIESPDFFNQMKNNTLHAAVIGHEIIRYNRVSEDLPWKLMDCERGSFDTQASSHQAGSTIGKLIDHPYKTFLTDNSLSEEVAKKIAELFNQTGLRQISFDGLEGNWSTGMGQYGRQRFVKIWYDHLKPELQGKVITDASNPGHFFWHMFTRMNWGEPWYAGFRESQTQLRLLNQDFFYRNLIPPMLGWFRMSPETSIEDIEWLLARAAGFDAGFCLVTSPTIVEKNGDSEEILQAIKNWEILRMGDAFSNDQKRLMQDISREFHLEKLSEESWRWIPVHTNLKNDHPWADKQPGEPTGTTFPFTNPYEEQPLQFTIKLVADSPSVRFTDISMALDQFKTIAIHTTLKPGDILQYKGDGQAILFDSSWNILRQIPTDSMMAEPGDHKILFDGKFTGEGAATVRIEFRVTGNAEIISFN